MKGIFRKNKVTVKIESINEAVIRAFIYTPNKAFAKEGRKEVILKQISERYGI